MHRNTCNPDGLKSLRETKPASSLSSFARRKHCGRSNPTVTAFQSEFPSEFDKELQKSPTRHSSEIRNLL